MGRWEWQCEVWSVHGEAAPAAWKHYNPTQAAQLEQAAAAGLVEFRYRMNGDAPANSDHIEW